MVGYALVVFAATLIAIILTTIRFRHSLMPDEAAVEMLTPLALRLLPGTPDGDLTEAELLALIGGSAGVRMIRRSIRTIGSLAANINRRNPSGEPAAVGLLWDSWMAYTCIGWAAWAQMQIRERWVPTASCPSVESLARLYCRMATTIDALESIRVYA